MDARVVSSGLLVRKAAPKVAPREAPEVGAATSTDDEATFYSNDAWGFNPLNIFALTSLFPFARRQ